MINKRAISILVVTLVFALGGIYLFTTNQETPSENQEGNENAEVKEGIDERARYIQENSDILIEAFFGEIKKINPDDKKMTVEVDMRKTFTNPLESYAEFEFEINDRTILVEGEGENIKDLEISDFKKGDKVKINVRNEVDTVYERTLFGAWRIKKINDLSNSNSEKESVENNENGSNEAQEKIQESQEN